jgi:hypothetical protein
VPHAAPGRPTTPLETTLPGGDISILADWRQSIDSGCGWYGTIRDFLVETPTTLQTKFSALVRDLNLPASNSQLRAWTESIRVLKRECQELADGRPSVKDWGLIFEYELPRERGRRPDVVLLTGPAAHVIEFKGRPFAEQSDIDQVAAYARDIREYHAASHTLDVQAVLALDDANMAAQSVDNVTVLGGRTFASHFTTVPDNGGVEQSRIEQWVRADYQPLPALVAAARRIFEHEPLPQIRRAASAGIPQALQALQRVARQAQSKGERHLALVTGVPGAGKTLVGLQFVYETRFSGDEGERPAVFLSGNGPLVAVLQHALKNKIFVQDVHGFLIRYGGASKKVPTEHIWVYDEAQRAWDGERVMGKRGHSLSEHEDFINLGMRVPDWAMLVGLIGEGQEIHLGEEGGLKLWSDAITANGGDWTIHCPEHIAHLFAGHRVLPDDALELTKTLRSHVAGDLHEWVKALLDGRLAEASAIADVMQKSDYNLYVTRDLDEAKRYVRSRYEAEEDKRFGLLGSSKAKNLPIFGMNTSFQATRGFRPGPWYNDPRTSLRSCCQLLEVATEFSCQGLELDFPIVGWDTDLVWDGVAWFAKSGRTKAHDARQLRLNSYRVLLTRGRDGMAIFVPSISDLDATYGALAAAGARLLRMSVAL